MAKDILSDAYVLMHPTRYQIIQILKEAEGPLYIAQIADKLQIDDKLASFHLSVLSKHGFVQSEFRLENPPRGGPKALKYYTLTEKVDQTLARIKEML